MRQDTISQLLRRYFNAGKTGSDTYFDADEIVTILDKFEQIEDFDNYSDLLHLGLRLHPGNVDLQLRRCRLHLRKQEFAEALSLVEATALVNNPEADLIRMECYYKLDNRSEAKSIVESLMESGSDYTEEACELFAILLNEREESTTNERDFIRRASQMFPENLIIKDEYCFSLETDGKYDEAIRICNEILDAEPYSYDDWFVLGRLHSLNESYDEAIEAFNTASICGEPDDELIANRAYCYYMNENYEKAIEAYRHILPDDDSETNYRIQSLLSDCYTRIDNYEDAYRILKVLISKSKIKDPYNNISYARCCLKTDRKQEALKILQHTAELFAGGMRIFTLLAYSCLENDMEDLSLMILEQIIKHLDKNSEELPTYNLAPAGKSHRTTADDQTKSIPAVELTRKYLNRNENRN
jgi:tetratricopeptide (TPR) repeat protein